MKAGAENFAESASLSSQSKSVICSGAAALLITTVALPSQYFFQVEILRRQYNCGDEQCAAPLQMPDFDWLLSEVHSEL